MKGPILPGERVVDRTQLQEARIVIEVELRRGRNKLPAARLASPRPVFPPAAVRKTNPHTSFSVDIVGSC